ncbi:hypothetical protein E1287_32075 [Actinomadura sp. KC06]|uniref:hypothetical protein n=1 Tax=Actinomadura sp. KC06 TaxID=2530369 RepID=UPI001053DCFC|nr:hypothetical protein [Actinomadura sp. KC06]TDD28849.1 hypothetical protein E1287_32075 [Actinomadura sp. KC06]
MFFVASTVIASAVSVLAGLTVATISYLCGAPAAVMIVVITSAIITTFGVMIAVVSLAAHLFINASRGSSAGD